MLRLLCLPVLLLSISTAALAQTSTVRVSADRTSVRDRAASDGAVVATVTKGEELTVISSTGSWMKVRTSSGLEGYVHNLFTDRPSASPSSPSMAPSATTAVPPQGGGGSSTAPDRRFGIGVGGGGLAASTLSPSARYWMNDKTGLEVAVSFYHGAGWTNTAISPSVMFRFSEPSIKGPVTFLPYYGGGLTYWKLSNSYWSTYFGPEKVSNSGLGFGGFVGTETVFEKLPRFTVSGNVGYYTSPAALGYGGIYLSLGFHYYLNQ